MALGHLRIEPPPNAVVEPMPHNPPTREENVPKLKVGLASEILNARHSPTALVHANYLTAVASRIDSLWVPDHLNSLLPRAIATPQYLGAAKLTPKVDAQLEPWTMLGHLAARNPGRAVATWCWCDRCWAPQSSGHRPGRRNHASANPRPGDPGHRAREREASAREPRHSLRARTASVPTVSKDCAS
jgi:hypothetical protein